jgi:hypothetical protein
MAAFGQVWKYVIGGAVGLAAGIGATALSHLDRKMEEDSPQHFEFRLMEQHSGELLHMILCISVMKDRYPRYFYALHEALKQLLIMEAYLHELPKRANWTKTASLYSSDVDQYSKFLKSKLHHFPNVSEELETQFDQIVQIAKDSAFNVGIINEEIHGVC